MKSLYVFRDIQPILSSDDLINVVLSKTQRKTPTEVHPKYQIQRIRAFYLRKIKFAADTFIEKFDNMLKGFPKLNEIHPFYADWLNVLYDKDHYKIALGQVQTVKGVIEHITKDYLKLMKYGDSLYRCKTLKVAALGRMCTAAKKLKNSFQYLEEVRKHISRLPAIDPFAPTMLLVGSPNVGKSSFINCVTNAKVEVSSLPFSTQNLFLGISEFKNVRVQIIDSPGLLNRPLEQRNTIEMQSVTALAHLKTCVLYMLDISESCGYLLEDQLRLFTELSPLFANKPVFLVLNKSDLKPRSALLPENEKLLAEFEAQNPHVKVIENSALDTKRTREVAELAAEELLQYRMSQKKDSKQTTLKTDEDYYRGVTIAHPTKLRGNRARPVHIPEAVLSRDPNPETKYKTLKDFQEEHGGAGVFNFPLQEHHILENPDWKYDLVPEFLNGINLTDYVDTEIEAKLAELEREEEERIKAEQHLKTLDDDPEFLRNKEALSQVRQAIYEKKLDSKLSDKNKLLPKKKLSILDVKRQMKKRGISSAKFEERMKTEEEEKEKRSIARRSNKMNIEGDSDAEVTHRTTRVSRDKKITLRGKWNDPKEKTELLRRKIQKKRMVAGQQGDPDHQVISKMPKHLFSGKRGIGHTDRR